MKLPCGFWCPRPENEKPNTSHGICDECAQQLQDQSDARHFDRVPSYVGERPQFEQYTQERKGRR
jgi:hypothetical protein